MINIGAHSAKLSLKDLDIQTKNIRSEFIGVFKESEEEKVFREIH
ncbi:hypothetical protein LCGC14_0657090 [marine sediment metagenome]|uniref:Uncharacterized protein n=1 Tax=marine sediment metagenome TaxID=412755 RepID=A0A0F9U321_9ZZZZ